MNQASGIACPSCGQNADADITAWHTDSWTLHCGCCEAVWVEPFRRKEHDR